MSRVRTVAARRAISVCVLGCLFGGSIHMQHASAQVDGGAGPAEPARVRVQDERSDGRTVRTLSVDAPEDGRSGGPGGVSTVPSAKYAMRGCFSCQQRRCLAPPRPMTPTRHP